MTPATAIELEYADGDYSFDLKLPQIAELQEKRGASLFAIYARTLKGRYVLPDGSEVGAPHEGEADPLDLFEVIRLGLIGGGKGRVNDAPVVVDDIMARKLVERYSHNAPLRRAWDLAASIMAARIEGYDPPKKAEPADEPATATS